MEKIWLIVKREYLTRIRNKTFLLSTFLTPLGFALIMGVVIWITVEGSDGIEKIAIADKENILKAYMDEAKDMEFVFDNNADTSLLQKGFTAVLFAPGNGINQSGNFQIYTSRSMSMATEGRISSKINSAMETRMMTELTKLSKEEYDSIRKEVKGIKMDNMVMERGSELKKGNSAMAYGLGYGTAFLIYITLFIYGAMVMRSVMEEKTSRIAEVMVSSVKPYQLMMGKIIGIGGVGVTQLLLWVILFFALSGAMGALIPAEVMQQVAAGSSGTAVNVPQTNEGIQMMAEAKLELQNVNWVLVIGSFLFYFVFGYLFYSAMFAAVGSAVGDDANDAQSLMMPITIPIILAIIIMINAINQPSSSLATWSSLIPFFSPIVMMARIPFGVPGTVPWWQLGLSMVLLVLGFIFVAWVSAKIYRTGILLYGKKVTLKEMWKWALR